ncbi:MAG: ABC transporter ATP-binding protein [Planctomycetales bacterium]|nr:ABC transporter ATP-binding protein [Planctomycetales bacterium]
MSDEVAIAFDHVSKEYHVDSAIPGGVKELVLHLPSHLRRLREREPLRVLNDVSFEIRRGQCVSFIGRNGAGKSTTLGLIAGVIRPSSGTVVARGRICPLLELGAGFHHELSGRDNIVLNGVLLGMTRAEVRERMDQIIAFSELGRLIDQPLRTYSSGMIARLGFSVAVHLEPDILLVDEALSVGDEAFQEKCVDRMKAFMEDDVTMVYVSHALNTVEEISDRVFLLDQGHLIAQGAPHEVVEEYHQRLGVTSHAAGPKDAKSEPQPATKSQAA